MAQTENLTLRQAATRLQVTDRTLLEMLGDGRIKGQKVGTQWRFRAEDLDAYLHSVAAGGGKAAEEAPAGQG